MEEEISSEEFYSNILKKVTTRSERKALKEFEEQEKRFLNGRKLIHNKRKGKSK